MYQLSSKPAMKVPVGQECGDVCQGLITLEAWVNHVTSLPQFLHDKPGTT
jgi:hypothetical protein